MDKIFLKNAENFHKKNSNKINSKKILCNSCGSISKQSSNNKNSKEFLCQICALANSNENYIETQESSNNELLFCCKYKYNGCKEKFDIKSLEQMLIHLKICNSNKFRIEIKNPSKHESIKYSLQECQTNFNSNLTERKKGNSKFFRESSVEKNDLMTRIKNLDEKYFSLFGYLNQKIIDLENKNISTKQDLNITLEELAMNKVKSSASNLIDVEGICLNRNSIQSDEKINDFKNEFNELICKFDLFDSYFKSYKQATDIKFKDFNSKFKKMEFRVNYSNLELQMKLSKQIFSPTLPTSRFRDTSVKPFFDVSRKVSSKLSTNKLISCNYKSDPSLLNFHSKFVYYDGINLPNIFSIFELEKDLILAYPAKDYNIDLIKIKNKQVLKTFIGHESFIFCIRHKKLNLTDYLISSSYDQSIKVWKLSNFSLMMSIENCHLSTSLYSCLLVCINNNEYIISSVFDNELIKVYDMNGILIKEMGNTEDKTLFIEY